MPGSSPRFPSPDPTVLPRWARAADAITLLLIAAGVIVAIGGGFRERFGGVRIAVTSPWGLWVGAAGVALLRHALERREPAPLRWRRAIGRGRPAAVNAALVGVLGTRPAILFVGYFALVAFGYIHDRPPVRFSENEIINLQARWDAPWYLTIATEGYRFQRNDSGSQQNIVFFPAFPTGVADGGATARRNVDRRLHRRGYAGLNWVAFFLALVYLFMLARDLLEREDAARAAVLLVATYPFALFYGAIYTESLYLLAAVGGVLSRAPAPVLCATAAWGLLVGLTRPNGCFLSIPLLLITAGPWLPDWLSMPAAARFRRPLEPSGGRRVAAEPRSLAAAACGGVGARHRRPAVLLRSSGVSLAIRSPGSRARLPGAATTSGFGTLVSDRYATSKKRRTLVTQTLPDDLLNALGALFVLALAVPVWRRLGLAVSDRSSS